MSLALIHKIPMVINKEIYSYINYRKQWKNKIKSINCQLSSSIRIDQDNDGISFIILEMSKKRKINWTKFYDKRQWITAFIFSSI